MGSGRPNCWLDVEGKFVEISLLLAEKSLCGARGLGCWFAAAQEELGDAEDASVSRLTFRLLKDPSFPSTPLRSHLSWPAS